jgi:hypothetical protein
MKFFNKQETKVIIFIFLVLFLVTAYNMSISLRRGRDSIRKNDMSAMQNALDTYYQKYRIFPQSTDDGKIIGCFDGEVIQDKNTGFPLNPIPCIWGESKFESINTLVRDPKHQKGASYLYKSVGKGYELYVSLEGMDEAEYQIATVNKNLQCGTEICNYGRVVN